MKQMKTVILVNSKHLIMKGMMSLLFLISFSKITLAQRDTVVAELWPTNKKINFSIDNTPILLNESQFDSLFSLIDNRNIYFNISKPRNLLGLYFIHNKDTTRLLINSKNVICNLVPFLYSQNQDWVANLILYSSFKRNSFDFNFYDHDDYVKWRNKQKEKDIEYWKTERRKLKCL